MLLSGLARAHRFAFHFDRILYSSQLFLQSTGNSIIFCLFVYCSCHGSDRFHQLHEFDQGKRSCRKRLECHNKRRRKPPLGPTSFNTNCIPSAFHEDNNSNNNRFKGFLVDFTNPKLPSLLQVAWQRGQLSDDQVHSHGYHSGSRAPSAIVVNHRDFPFMQQVSPPGSSQPLTGGSDSSCALSLLSTQPWDNHIGISATAEGEPTAKPIACENDYMSNSWTPKDLETSSRTSFEVRVNQVGEDESGSHFAGELELVLQGKKQCMGLDLSRRCKDSDEGIHWSL
ncbi:squamosa promoter-binding-like protein 17 isoform X2 [Canna indica]|uniref:Squamosa promoter-binding-like protein 17 isoform X2 n=1 Tax=Canna indica TaxID=4628 RepID=A0AAQ3Q5Y1_9LILI|nr:squamosa promoter-binding-like protein 17 isoform X2 [Canna indica]